MLRGITEAADGYGEEEEEEEAAGYSILQHSSLSAMYVPTTRESPTPLALFSTRWTLSL
jgi:hypothetical protein